MLKIIPAILISLTLLVVFPNPIFAAFSLSQAPSNVTEDQEFQVNIDLTISGSSGKNYYLRAAFSHPNTSTSYFGYTKDNAGTWYNGTPSPIDHTKFYKITMDQNNSWSGSISVKPDPASSSYKGAGNYNFKVGRYTEAGSGPTWSDATLTIAISAPTPSPSPSPSPSATPTSSPTKTPTPTPTPAVSPTPAPRATGVTIKLSDLGGKRGKDQVLGIKEATKEEDKPTEATESATAQVPLAAGVFMISGLGLLGFSFYSFLKSRKSSKIADDDQD